MLVRKYIVTGALLALVVWLERRARAGGPDGTVLASSYVQKNGACYKVTFYTDGRSSSTAVDAAHCEADAAPGDLSSVVDDPAAGFRGLVHLFDDL